MKTLKILVFTVLATTESSLAQYTCQDFFDFPKSLQMRRVFRGEDQGVWVSTATGVFGTNVDVPSVFIRTEYLQGAEQDKTRAWINPKGLLVTSFTEASLHYIFVVTQDGQLRVSPRHLLEGSIPLIKHSSLSRGESVWIAGEIFINENGFIYKVTNKSGHYLPPGKNLDWFERKYFKEKGISTETIHFVNLDGRFE